MSKYIIILQKLPTTILVKNGYVSILPKLVCRVNNILIRLTAVFLRSWELIVKFTCKRKRQKKGVFEEGRPVLLDMKQYYDAIGIKIKWY